MGVLEEDKPQMVYYFHRNGKGYGIMVSDRYHYRVVEGWGRGPEGKEMGGVTPGVVTDSRDRVYVARRDPLGILVADRENNRIQLFDFEGNFLGAWTDVQDPNDMYVDDDDILYVSEAPLRVSVFDLDGKLLARWGEGCRPRAVWSRCTGSGGTRTAISTSRKFPLSRIAFRSSRGH